MKVLIHMYEKRNKKPAFVVKFMKVAIHNPSGCVVSNIGISWANAVGKTYKFTDSHKYNTVRCKFKSYSIQ